MRAWENVKLFLLGAWNDWGVNQWFWRGRVVGTARGIAGLYGSLWMFKPEILRCKKKQFYSKIRSRGGMASPSLENALSVFISFAFRGICLFRGHQHLPSTSASWPFSFKSLLYCLIEVWFLINFVWFWHCCKESAGIHRVSRAVGDTFQ